MKKFILVLMLIVFALSGCSSSAPDTESDFVGETAKSTQSDSIQLTQQKYKDITFNIPSDWEIKDIDNGNFYAYANKNDFLTIVSTPCTELNDDFFDGFVDSLLNNDMFETAKPYNEQKFKINSHVYYSVDADTTADKAQNQYRFCATTHSGEAYMFMMRCHGDEFKYNSEIESILESVKFESTTNSSTKTIETKTITYGNATVKIPASWVQRDLNNNNIYFYAANNDFLMLNCSEINNSLDDEFVDLYMDSFFGNEDFSNCQILNKEKKEIHNDECYIVSGSLRSKSQMQPYCFKISFLKHVNDLYVSLFSSQGKSFIYDNEFDILLNSFKFAKETPSSTPKNETSYPKTSAPASKKELPDRDEMILKITKLFEQDLAFDVGSYVMGDIPKGEYAFIGINSSKYYCEKDAAGNIIDNENFQSFGYVYVHGLGNVDTRGVLVSVNTFETLGVTGAKQLYEILNKQTNYTQGGMYKVGLDIPAGTYTIESIGNGYFALLTGPVGNNDIIDNDNFTGKKQVYASNGQYLELSRCQLIVSQ